MSTTTIELPTDFVANIWLAANNFFAGLSPYITVVIAVLLGALILELIIGALRR